MTNQELISLINDYLNYKDAKNNEIFDLDNLNNFIYMCEKYYNLPDEIYDFKPYDVNFSEFNRVPFEETVNNVVSLFTELGFNIDNEVIDNYIKNGNIGLNFFENKDYTKSEFMDNAFDGFYRKLKDDNFMVDISYLGNALDSIVLSHELAHHIFKGNGDYDHYETEVFAIFIELIMNDKLKSKGYIKESKFDRLFRLRATINNSNIKEFLMVLEVFLTTGGIEYNDFKMIYHNMKYDRYIRIIDKVKDRLTKKETENYREYYRRIDFERSSYYVFACLISSYMFYRYKEDPSYLNNVKSAISYPTSENIYKFLQRLELDNNVDEKFKYTIREISKDVFDKEKTL